MYHPTTRLLTVLDLLQTHGQLSGSELAARLEVDSRTVRRYIVMLQDMGIPIEAELGRQGGYMLRPGFKLPPMMFTNEEVLALILGLLVVQHLGLTAASCSVNGAMAKLQRVLPEPLRDQVEAMQTALVFNMPAPEQRIHGSVLVALGRAIHGKYQVTFDYQKDSNVTQRIVDPYGLVCHDGGWYLVGYCHLRSTIRIFRLDRVTRVYVRQDTFIPPVDFNSLTYLFESFANIPDRWNIEVILKTTLEKAAGAIPSGLGSLIEQPQGVLFKTAVGDIDWMARFLVNLGFPVCVCQPPELRTAFERLALEILQFARSET
ncbi:MAG: YafY family protein [Chloroflexota bacterium]